MVNTSSLQRRSETNSANRAKQKQRSVQGSQSTPALRYKKVLSFLHNFYLCFFIMIFFLNFFQTSCIVA